MYTKNTTQNKLCIHITYELYPQNLGGIGMFVFNLVNYISKYDLYCKYEVIIPVNQYKYENIFQSSNISIILIKDCFIQNKLNFNLFCNKLKKYLDTKNLNNCIIHFHDITLFHLLGKYKNLVYTFHKDDGIKIPKDRKISAVIYFTKYSRNKNFISAYKHYIIPNGMLLNTREKATIAYIGRNSQEKGFDKFLNYVNSSKNSNTYITIGAKYKYDKRIISFDFLDNLQIIQKLEEIDYLFVPSSKEEFGLIILEALNKNTKIFVQNLKQLKELYSKFKNVIFIDFQKANYIKKIDNYIEKDFYHQKKMLTKFSIQKIAEKYVEVYNGV